MGEIRKGGSRVREEEAGRKDVERDGMIGGDIP